MDGGGAVIGTVSEKRVRDLMRSLDNYPCIGEGKTIGDAFRLLAGAEDAGKRPCLVAVGEDRPGKKVIKGFVTAPALVFGLAAHFLKGARRSGPIFWEGQMKAECLEGTKRRIEEIMLPIRGCVREEEMLMEAVFLLNRYGLDFLPVVREEDVTGIIHIEDILMEIKRIVQA